MRRAALAAALILALCGCGADGPDVLEDRQEAVVTAEPSVTAAPPAPPTAEPEPTEPPIAAPEPTAEAEPAYNVPQYRVLTGTLNRRTKYAYGITPGGAIDSRSVTTETVLAFDEPAEIELARDGEAVVLSLSEITLNSFRDGDTAEEMADAWEGRRVSVDCYGMTDAWSNASYLADCAVSAAEGAARFTPPKTEVIIRGYGDAIIDIDFAEWIASGKIPQGTTGIMAHYLYGGCDLSPLNELPFLTAFSINDNHWDNIEPLRPLTKLEILNISYNHPEDLSPLAGMTRLKHLYMDACYPTDLSPLAGLTALEELHIYRHDVSDLSPLAGLVNLRSLELASYGGDEPPDITPLMGLKKLEWAGLHASGFSEEQVQALREALPMCDVTYP